MKPRTPKWLQAASTLRDRGLSVLPLHSPDLPNSTEGDEERSIGKKPLVQWQEYQERLPSVEEIDRKSTRLNSSH